ncbi:MAG: VWA domain-containing protein [Acidobacteriota bacterium]|nr:VWA domain-containing protein [Acidobacteriota bacterium]
MSDPSIAYGPYTHAVFGFCRFLRENGMNPGTGLALEALAVARTGVLTDRRAWFHGLRALFCGNREDFDRFPGLFDAWWTGNREIEREKTTPKPKPDQWQKLRAMYLGGESDRPAEEEGSETTGASAVDYAMTIDLAKIPSHQMEEMEALAMRLARRLSLRLSRRFKQARRGGRLDMRRTIRKSIARGGDPLELCRRGKRPRRPRLVFFLDCSGSMDRYSLFFLRFIYILRQHYPRVDAFLFSTRLTRISNALARADMEEAMTAVSESASGWSGGTCIGLCLQTFIAVHGRDMLSRGTRVIILSDGLDTGEPGMLGDQLAAVKRRARSLIWLNPLTGGDAYKPEARGMREALPYLDHFLPGHNLESLCALESLLAG